MNINPQDENQCKANKLTNFLMTSGYLTQQKIGIIQSFKEKFILPEENLTKDIQIQDSTISDFMDKLNLIPSKEGEGTEENLNLNSDLLKNLANKENSKFIFIFLFSIISKNNLGETHYNLTKKLTESFIFLKSLEDFFKNSIEQFEKIYFILNEKAKPFISNFTFHQIF